MDGDNSAVVLVSVVLGMVLVFLLLRGRAEAVPEKVVAEKRKSQWTMAEVAEHCTEDDLWIVVDGKVYDVTDYVDAHPGGDALMRGAGRDATKGFKGPQHPDTAYETILDFCIGDVVDG